MGGEQRFEIMARGGADEVASLRGEQVGNGAGIVAPDCFAGEDDRAGVDIPGAETRFTVSGVDELAERLIIDALASGTIGCEVDRRQVKRVAFSYHEAAG